MYIWGSLFAVALMLLGAALACFFDHRKRRTSGTGDPVSFLIPCYNDGATVEETVNSILTSRGDDGPFEILIGDDASTDQSAAILESLARRLPLRIERNPVNLGKAGTLNRLARLARHDLLLFVDADTCLNTDALRDLLARLVNHDRVGAVSCPYRPANRGWLPRLQSIDYSMIAILQGAYNLVSGLALWGGCIAIRKSAFEQAGGFCPSAITEDVNLAFVLNRHGWRVEQSLLPVDSHVPDTCRGWIRQKIRWTAGGFQCLLRHPAVWLRHPLQVLLLLLYAVLSINAVITLVRQTLALDRILDRVTPLVTIIPIGQIWDLIRQLYGSSMLGGLQLMLCFMLLSAIYVVPLISRWRDSALFLLIIPFSLAYFPLYVMVSIAGLAYLTVNSRRIERTLRAW